MGKDVISAAREQFDTYMKETELRKLGREDLLEIILEQNKIISSLESKLRISEEKLKNRYIEISECGSVAEASLKLSRIFEEAEAACSLYTENIKRRSDNAEAQAEQIKKEAEKKAAEIIAQAELRGLEIKKEAERECAKLQNKVGEQSGVI